MTIPKLTQTAPERIWLQVNTDDTDDCHQPFPYGYGSEVTWCSESVGGAEVAYVRKDLADAEIERFREASKRLARAADAVGVQYFDTDDMSDEVAEMQEATLRVRAILTAKEIA